MESSGTNQNSMNDHEVIQIKNLSNQVLKYKKHSLKEVIKTFNL